MPSEERVFTPRETKFAVWIVMGALALTAAGMAARQTVMTPDIEQAPRVTVAEVSEAQPLSAEAFL